MNIPSFLSFVGRLSILVFFSVFTSFVFAQKAKFVEVDRWGSNTYYNDSAFIGDLAFHPQSQSPYVDVQSLDPEMQSSLVTQLDLGERIESVYSFNEFLVVTFNDTLAFYDISDLDNPEVVFAISSDGSNGYSNKFSFENNRILYLDSQNKIYLIEYAESEFQLIGVLQAPQNDYDNRIYYDIHASGLDGDYVYIAYNKRDYGNELDPEFYIEGYLFEEDELTLEIVYLDDDRSYLSWVEYIGNGNFALIKGNNTLITYTLQSGDYIKTSRTDIDVQMFSPDFAYHNNTLSILSWYGYFTQVDLSNPLDFELQMAPRLPRTEGIAFDSPKIKKFNDRTFVRSLSFFGELLADEFGDYYIDPFYFQSGITGTPIVYGDSLYVVKERLMHEIDVSDPKALSLLDSQFVKPNHYLENLLSNNDSIFVSDGASRFFTSDIEDISDFDAYFEINLSSNTRLVSKSVIDDSIFTNAYGSASLYRYDASSYFSVITVPEEIELNKDANVYSLDSIVEAAGHIVVKFYGDNNDIYIFNNAEDVSDINIKSIVSESYIQSIVGTEKFLFTLGDRVIQTWAIENSEAQLVHTTTLADLEIYNYFSGLTSLDGYILAGTDNYSGNDATYMFEVSEQGALSLVSSSVFPAASNWNQNSTFVKHNDHYIETTEQSGVVRVYQINKQPSADAADYAVVEDESFAFTLEATDPEDDELTVELQEASLDGLITIEEGTLNLVFVPNENFTGETSARVLVKDVHENSVEVELTFTVEPVNDAPELTELSLEVNEDSPLSSVIAATDVDGDSLTYEVVTAPANGTIELLADGSLTYQPNENFFGTDTFEVQFTDGNSDPVTQTVTIEVAPVNDMPVAASATLSGGVTEGRSVTMELGITDMDADAMTYTVTSDAAKGTVSVSSSGVVTYTANTGTSGSDSFVVTASDGMGGEVSVSLTVDIAPAPVVNNSSDSSGRGGSLPLSALMAMLMLAMYRCLMIRKYS
ncbi:MAG: hypothetical protein Alis3KO_38290 [Aliiglaciecola sp.]